MPRVIHFEMAVDDPENAAAFYRRVFGWEIQKWSGPVDYWLVTTGAEGTPGIDGGILKAMGGPPVANTIDVSSVDEYIEKITQAGGSVVMPKHAIPGVGYHAYCKDTQGVIFGILQPDSSAA